MGSVTDPNYVSTRELAAERFENSQQYAAAAFTTATDFLNHLSDLADETYVTDECAVDDVEFSLDSSDPVRPENPTISMSLPAAPTAPVVSDVLVGTISGIPAFDVPEPSIVFPLTPEVEDIQDVGNIPSISDVAIPAKPTYDIPAVPTFSTAPIPSVPDLNLPAFEGVMPIDDLNTPTNTFNFTESMYGSDLLNAVRAKLEADVASGGTGLGAAVEDAIWLREQERAEIAAREAKETISSDWENRGFNLPDGVVTAAMLDVDLKLAADRATSSRDIAVKQAELALANQHFTIQQGIVLEGQLMSYASQMAQRTLEANKTMIEMAIAIFNAEVAKYGAKLDGYKTQAAVYESRIRASLATAELYKAQIEGAKLVTEQNIALVELYKAQISGIDSLIKLYSAEMEAARVTAETDRTKIEAFKAQVAAYAEKVQLNVAKFNMYEAAIKGEAVKAQVYESRVSAYESRVKASSIEAQVTLETAKVESELQKLRVESYAAEIEAFKSLVQSEGIRVNSLIDIYKGEVEAYKADASVNATALDSQIKEFQARIEQAIAKANVCTKMAEIKMQAYAHVMGLRAEVTKGGAAVAAQLAASAMAGVQASASLHDNQDLRTSISDSYEYGDKTVRYYNYTA